MRAVSPWTWRRALRDHGPRCQGLLLTLYTVGTYMRNSGYAYPGQALIAQGARTTSRTVRRHIAEAQRTGWLAVECAGRGGKGWRHNAYRACVPDDVYALLSDVDESISDHIQAQCGDVEYSEGEDIIASSAMDSGEDMMMSSAHAPTAFGGEDIRGTHVRTTDTSGEDIGSTNVRTQSCPPNSCSETPALRTPAKTEAQDAQSRVRAIDIGRQAPKQVGTMTAEERLRKARTLLDADPEIDNAKLMQSFGLTIEEVQEIRATGAAA